MGFFRYSKMFKCESCFFESTKVFNLNRHKLRVHTEQQRKVGRPKTEPKCSLCLKIFNTSSALRKHIVRKHKESNVDDIDEQPTEQIGQGVIPKIQAELVSESEYQNPRFNTLEIKKCFELSHNLQGQDLLRGGTDKMVDIMIQDILQPILLRASPKDTLSVTLSHDSLETGTYAKDVHITSRMENFDIERILNKIYSLSQSNSVFLLDGKLSLCAKIIQVNGRKK